MYRRIPVAQTSYLVQRLGYWPDYRRIGVQFPGRTDIFVHSVQNLSGVNQVSYPMRTGGRGGVVVVVVCIMM
jgi:hypothetical protein